jgi:hypothetical protein
MGLMDFLKKRSDSGLGSDASSFDIGNSSLDSSSTPLSNLSNPSPDYQPEHLNPSMNLSSMNSSFSQSSAQPMSQGPDMSKDLQMISLKLDAIKSELDAMNQRLKSLEMIAEREQSRSTKKWY